MGGFAMSCTTENLFMPTRSDEFDIATTALAADGWYVFSNLMSLAQTQALASECLTLHNAQLLTPARVGADRDASLLRGDSTSWFLPEALSVAQQAFADRIEVLRIALSRNLLLGLVDSESHYAVYQPGIGYARHLDCLRNNNARVVSAVFYLNDAWQETEGGALRLSCRSIASRYLSACRHAAAFPFGGFRARGAAGHTRSHEHCLLDAAANDRCDLLRDRGLTRVECPFAMYR